MEVYDNSSMGGGGSGVVRDFDYARAEEDLNKISNAVNNMLEALSKKIEVSSYKGSQQEKVAAALNTITDGFKAAKIPLEAVSAKITEVKEGYNAAETKLGAELDAIVSDYAKSKINSVGEGFSSGIKL